jgi:hypothetical protein
MLVDVVDGAVWDADARQLSASRTDMTRAIGAAEQAEFDRLLRHRQETTMSRGWTRWTPDLEARLLRPAMPVSPRWQGARGYAPHPARPAGGTAPGGPGRPHERKRRADEWSADLIARLRQAWAAGRYDRTPGAI